MSSFISLTVSNDAVDSGVPFNGTMKSYWDNCKMNNIFITGNTHKVCQNESTWTGIRTYKIGNRFIISVF